MRYPFLESGCWIFDLDGTLTRPVHDFEHIRKELGIAPQADILQAISQQPAEERRQLNERLDQLELFYAEKARPASGVLPLLDLLNRRGCRLGILTRNKKDIAISSLLAIGADGYFSDSAIIGRDEAAAKPDPHGINILLALWQKSSNDAVMVGDFRYDLEVGRAAGTATIHVDDRADRDWPELTDLKVSSLTQLHKMINF